MTRRLATDGELDRVPAPPVSATARPQRRVASGRAVTSDGSPAPTWGLRYVVVVLVALAGCAVVGMPMALAVLTVLMLGALVLGAGHPMLAALAMTCVAVLDGHAADSLQPALATISGGLWRYNTIGFAFALLAVVGLPATLRRPDLHSRLALALACLLAVGMVWSPDRLNGAQSVLDMVAFFGMLFVFLRIANDPEAWYWIGVVGGTLAAGASLTYLAAWPHIPFTNPNVAVFVPLTGLAAICLALACGARTPGRQYVLASLAIVNALCAFLSTSRGGLLTAAACLVFIGVQVRGHRRRALILGATVVMGIVVTSFFAPLQQTALQRLSLLVDRTAAVQTRTSGRSDLVIGSWQIFKAHPFGVGTGGFETAWATLGSVGGQRRFFRSGQRFAAHAGWMRVLAENGWIGFITLAAFVGSFASAGIRLGPSARRLGLFATCTLGLSLVTTEFHLKGLFFLAAGVAAALPLPFIETPVTAMAGYRALRVIQQGAADSK